jgi:hypothetical protein
MSETNEQKGQEPAPAVNEASPQEPQPATELGKDGKPFDAARAQALIEKLDAEAKEGKKAAKRLAELEAKEKERAEAELSELDKANKKIAEYEAKLKASERRELQKSVADKVGLPSAFATRIQGETEEDMEEDAKSLLAAMPAKVAPKIDPTNPGGIQTGETEAQKKARLLG